MSITQLALVSTVAVLTVSAVALLVLCLVLVVECIAALFPVPSVASGDSWQNARVTVLVPAHNEEVVIHSTLVELSAALKKQDRLVVIADNCTDATAEIARGAGATVIERFDSERRGKGYALDYGLQFIASDPPDVVVFVDADCQVDQGTIEQLTKRAIATERPVQATYLMEKPSNPKPKDSVSAFALKVKNLVRSRGLARLGQSCLLAGSGMAFPWSVIRSVDLASGNIVEDMKLGFDLSIAGHRPMFCPEANVIGHLPQQTQAAKSQRTRWEHGHLQSIVTYAPQLIKASVQQKRLDLLISALDLCVPPLSLLVVLWLALMASSLLAGVLGISWIPATLLATAGFFLLTAILVAWTKFGRADLPLLELLVIPFYVLWKIPLYLKFFVKPQSAWVRTERDSVQAANVGDLPNMVSDRKA